MHAESVEQELRRTITQNGFIPIDEMMKIILSGSHSAYYRHAQPLGEGGDFVTSPEISQIFGEMIGIWCVDLWRKLGSPAAFNLIELGPGRGTLMRDLLNATKSVPEFCEGASVTFLEINPRLIEEQKRILRDKITQVQWVSSISEIPDGISIIITNEFFDAIPTKQYLKVKNEWYEVVLVMDPKNYSMRFDKLRINSKLISQLEMDHQNAGDGAVVEESLEAIDIMRSITKHIVKNSGGALIIDYGYDIAAQKRQNYQYNSTLQGVKNHKFHPVLGDFGEVDLSVHVDFHTLKQVAITHGARIFGSITQGNFLNNLGAQIRLQALQASNPDLREILAKQYHRLTANEQMGSLFKVIAITDTKVSTPIGFEV